MATKSVLKIAIDKLETVNKDILRKIAEESDKSKIQVLKQELQKNKSMILDYKFRLKYE
jgi:hypothetical protein